VVRGARFREPARLRTHLLRLARDLVGEMERRNLCGPQLVKRQRQYRVRCPDSALPPRSIWVLRRLVMFRKKPKTLLIADQEVDFTYELEDSVDACRAAGIFDKEEGE
jgi:hypothetical protein